MSTCDDLEASAAILDCIYLLAHRLILYHSVHPSGIVPPILGLYLPPRLLWTASLTIFILVIDIMKWRHRGRHILEPRLPSLLHLPGNLLTLDGRLNVDEDLDLDPLRLDFRSGDPESPLTADPDVSQCERDSVVLTIQDHSDSPRQGKSVVKWLDEWKRKWENMCKLVKYAHPRRTFRDDLVRS